jgi:hypothetical protein
LALGFGLLVVYYNLFFFCDNLNFGGATGLPWFVYLFFWGSYWNRFGAAEPAGRACRRYLAVALGVFASRAPFYLLWLVTKKEIFLAGATVFDSVYNSIGVFVASLAFFRLFLSMRISLPARAENTVRRLASCAFAVYLIHDNCHLRPLLWGALDDSCTRNGGTLLLYWLGTVLLVYLLCSVIELGRQRVFRATVGRALASGRMDAKLEELANRLA